MLPVCDCPQMTIAWIYSVQMYEDSDRLEPKNKTFTVK